MPTLMNRLKPIVVLLCLSSAVVPCTGQTQEQRPEVRSAPMAQQFTRSLYNYLDNNGSFSKRNRSSLPSSACLPQLAFP